MKKIIVMCALIIVMLCGCTNKTDSSYFTEINDRFTSYQDGNSGMGYNVIIVDKETKVMYLFHGAGYRGGLTLMVDEIGNPLIWNEN